MNRPTSNPVTDRCRAALLAALAAGLLCLAAAYAAWGHTAPNSHVAGVDRYAVRINAAAAAELELLPGIGPAMSQRIVEERSRRPFADAGDLTRVRGIGPKTASRIVPHVVFD